MSTPDPRNDRYLISVTHGPITLTVDPHDLFEDMDEDDRLLCAQALTWDTVMDEAARRLAGVSENFAGEDWKNREEFLALVLERATGDVEAAEESRKEAWDRAWATEERAREVANAVLLHLQHEPNGAVPDCCLAAIRSLSTKVKEPTG